jgi:hypothetical protein
MPEMVSSNLHLLLSVACTLWSIKYTCWYLLHVNHQSNLLNSRLVAGLRVCFLIYSGTISSARKGYAISYFSSSVLTWMWDWKMIFKILKWESQIHQLEACIHAKLVKLTTISLLFYFNLSSASLFIFQTFGIPYLFICHKNSKSSQTPSPLKLLFSSSYLTPLSHTF